MNERTQALVKAELEKAKLRATRPLGACYITVGSQTSCGDGMDEKGCHEAARNVGGTAMFREGETCR